MNYIVDNVVVGDGKIDYIAFGQGQQPLVLLPGLSLLPITPMAQSVVMRYRAFHNDYKVYHFDRRLDVPQDYNAEDIVHDTALAMKSLGIENAYVMGWSQGGMIAQLMAIYYPQLVAKVVLCNTASHVTPMGAQVVGRWVELAQQGDVVKLNRDIFAHVYSQAYYNLHLQSFVRAESIGTKENMKRFVTLANSTQNFDSRPMLDRITCPALVVGSSIDNVLGGESAPEIADALQCQLLMYHDCGHAAFDEAPDLHQHIIDFFQDRLPSNG